MKLTVELKDLNDRQFKRASGKIVKGKRLKYILSKEIEGVTLSLNVTFDKDVWGKYAKEVTDSFGKQLVLEIYTNQSELEEFLE